MASVVSRAAELSRFETRVMASLGGLDRLRALFLRASLAIAPTRWILARRERRLVVTMTLGTIVSAILAFSFPAFLFATTPIVFGIPHLLGDVRYLIVRRDLPRAQKWWLLLPAPLFVAFRALEMLRGVDVSVPEMVCLGGWIAVAIVFGFRCREGGRLSWLRVALAACALFALLSIAVREPYLFRVAYAHLHNVVGPVLWAVFFRSSLLVGIWPLLVIGLASFALLACVTLPVHGFDTAFGERIAGIASWMAPGVSPEWGTKLVVLFVFLQGIHYAVWISWIPQIDTRAEGTLSFRMTFASLLKDFRAPVLLLSVASMVGLLLFATQGVQRARLTYLGIATFHGYLELVMFAYFFVRQGLRPHRSRAPRT